MRVIDETQQDIVRIIDSDHDFAAARSGDFQSDFIPWLHQRARRVPPLRRNVLMSDEIAGRRAEFPAIDRIAQALRAGQNVEPWLSERTRRNPADHRADLMFNDWQIIHFHLGNVFQSPTTIARTGPLLYAHITAEEVTFLDVQQHQQWTRLALLDILLRTNPAAMERWEGRGVTGQKLTDEQYQNLRLNGYNTYIEVQGRAFMLAMGRMSGQYAMRMVLFRDHFFQAIGDLKHNFGADRVPEHLKPAIYRWLGIPVRLGVWYDPAGLAVIDKNRQGLVLHHMKPLE